MTISWSKSPKGDAIEAQKGSGVGFFSEKGELVCVIFDEVQSETDHQILEFTSESVEVTVKNGQTEYSTIRKQILPNLPKKCSRRKLSIPKPIST